MSQAGLAVKEMTHAAQIRRMRTKGIRGRVDHNMLSLEGFAGLNP